ncbi:alginate lyase family protein [Brevibacillus sp. H7]|uniref:alginate lyase family protein n=1 Tax=Brevibacillus sp. H7 TaxID=3349138 RepID=UPI0037F6A42C
MLNRKKILLIIAIAIVVVIGSLPFLGTSSAAMSLLKVYEPFYIENKHKNKDYIRLADELINQHLIVSEDISEDVTYDINHIDWDVNATSSPNTFSLYLHTLRPVFYLTKAYVETNDPRYIQAAEKFVFSWNDYEKSTQHKNRYTWYDHSVAERTENLIYFSIIYQTTENNMNGKVEDLIRNNAEWLMNDQNYTKNHNHGIFEDGSLIKAGYYLANESYVKKGIERLNKQLQYAFPNKYIHIENSIGYHLGIISYMKNVGEFLHTFKNDYAKTAMEYVNGALDYLVYVIKPNLTVPFLGDTIGSLNGNSISDHYGNEHLSYVQSKGTAGIKPDKLSRIYQEDGYAIFREHWNSENYNQSTWLLFKSGYNSSTHKHADDLSFLLYSKGHDIFIDPGMYNYMVGNEIHDYMNSNFAHNTVIVDEQSYSISMFNSRKVGLYGYKKENGYEVVTGFNNVYDGVNIDRSISYINGNHFLIVDDIVSRERHKYSQVFHLANDVELVKWSRHDAILKIKGTDYYVLLQQLNGADDAKKYSGNEDPHHLSYVSNGLNKVEETTTIAYHKWDSSTRFITSIRIVKQEELAFFAEQKPEYDGSTVKTGTIKIKVSSRERLPKMIVDVQFDGNQSTIINYAQSSEQLAHSFYLLDKETGKKYASSSYSFDNHASFSLEKGKSYAVIGYMRNKAKETSKKLIGFIEDQGGKFIFKEVPFNKQEPVVTGNSAQKVSNNTYEFKVNISNINKINSRWYIYKDGASYDFIANQSDRLEYTFKEPGVYTCIYRINDVYFGEVEYNHFKGIVIQ